MVFLFASTATPTTCQPPPCYTLAASVTKYYKAVKQGVTWRQAKDACTSDGTFLVELRTAAEYLAIRPIFGKLLFKINFYFIEVVLITETTLSSGQFWTGLINPSTIKCDNSSCVNKLKWDSDGSNFDNWVDKSRVSANGYNYCLRYKKADNIDDKECALAFYYICQYECPTGTQL